MIREHDRGRSLDEILNDRYILNRTTPQQLQRLLENPDLVRALGQRHDRVRADDDELDLELAADAALARALDAQPRRAATSHAAIPFDLKTTTSSSLCAAAHLARDDVLKLVHLEPVEHALRHGLDQVARLEPRLLARVAADEGRALEDGVVELTRVLGRSPRPRRRARPAGATRRGGRDPSRSSR